MLMTDIIAKKRDKKVLKKEEIEFFVKGATNGSVPDYQLSALLMAIYLNGMNEQETAALTLAMANSGEILDLSMLGNKTVDKHSTGGVGDKTTLICAPIAAALGCTVAKMSGRGLGHTGGTVDKLEAITGYKTSISKDEFINISKKYGLCLTGHNKSFAVADSKLYALRDVTSTIENIPLIASSIMSKKIAAGAKNIVLDVKYGSGAFMKTAKDAEALAEAMVKIGNSLGRKTCALITDMDIPLGNAIGNALEVKEAVDILCGKGDKRLRELCVSLAANMYSLCFDEDVAFAQEKAEKTLEDGSAFKKLCESVKALGGDTNLLTGKKEFEKAKTEKFIYATEEGYISAINSEAVGKAAGLAGAGRETLEAKIDYFAGVTLLKKYGDYVKWGEKLAIVEGEPQRLSSSAELLSTAFSFSSLRPEEKPLIYKRIVRV